MTQRHCIRLDSVWHRRTSSNADVRLNLPDEVQGRPSVTYVRKFNRPSGLNDSTKVLLVVESWIGTLVSLTLNDVALTSSNRSETTSFIAERCEPLDPAPDGSRRAANAAEAEVIVDVTSLLNPFNQLVLRLDAIDDSVALIGPVRLEIEGAVTDG